MDLTNRLSTRYNFSGYTYIDVMIGEANENLVKAVLKYNPKKCNSSIFNYFTTIAWHAFQFRINEESKQHATKHRHYQYTYRLSELDGNDILDLSDNEYSNRVIEEYERKYINKQSTSKKKVVVKKSPPKGVEKLMIKKTKKRVKEPA